MSHPRGHRAEVRARINHSARRLFNRHGFDNVSLAQIMAGAGLTHGGFYSYFEVRAPSIPRFWRASLQIPIGRVAGKASK